MYICSVNVPLLIFNEDAKEIGRLPQLPCLHGHRSLDVGHGSCIGPLGKGLQVLLARLLTSLDLEKISQRDHVAEHRRLHFRFRFRIQGHETVVHQH